MFKQRPEQNLWRKIGPRLGVGALGLVTAAFLLGCGQNSTPPPRPLPTPASVVTQPTLPPAPRGPVTSGNDSGAPVSRVTGNFVAAQQASMAFQTSGRIKEYMVKEGDKVEAGVVLATLDSSMLEFQVAQAEAALELAKARLQQTQTPVSAEQLAAVQSALRAAESNFARVSAGPLPDELAAAKSNVDRAKAALDQAQALYDKAGGASNPYAGLLPTSVGLQQATSGYEAALAQFNLAKDHPTATELAAAASQLAQARAGVAQLTPTGENLSIAEAGVDQAQAAVDLANASLNNATLIAPFAGTAVMTGPKVGEYVSPGTPIVILADLSKMQVLANVDELTLGGLKLGQPATLFVDALAGEPLSARISRLGLFATNVGGGVTVPVTLDVDPTDAPIYPGLSADIQFEEAQ